MTSYMYTRNTNPFYERDPLVFLYIQLTDISSNSLNPDFMSPETRERSEWEANKKDFWMRYLWLLAGIKIPKWRILKDYSHNSIFQIIYNLKSRCFWLLFAAMPKSNEPSTECWMRYRWVWCMSRTEGPKTWRIFFKI